MNTFYTGLYVAYRHKTGGAAAEHGVIKIIIGNIGIIKITVVIISGIGIVACGGYDEVFLFEIYSKIFRIVRNHSLLFNKSRVVAAAFGCVFKQVGLRADNKRITGFFQAVEQRVHFCLQKTKHIKGFVLGCFFYA